MKVEEYWLVDPANTMVQVYALGDRDRYGRPEVFAAEETVKAGIFSDWPSI